MARWTAVAYAATWEAEVAAFHEGRRGRYLSRQSSHDCKSGHVQSNTSASCKLGLIHLCPATHNIPGPTAGFDNDCRKQRLLCFLPAQHTGRLTCQAHCPICSLGSRHVKCEDKPQKWHADAASASQITHISLHQAASAPPLLFDPRFAKLSSHPLSCRNLF